MCTPFSWASLGSALSRGPWGTDAQNSTVAMPWLRSRSKKVAEMVMESHWVPRKKRSQEHREEEMEGRAGRCWRVDGWTGQSQDGTPGYRRGGVLPTDVTTEGAAPGGVAGRAQACSPVFAILDGGLAKAGPLQEWGIPASVCAGGEDAVLWGRRGRAVSQKTKVVTNPASFFPFYHKQWRGELGGKKDVALTLGGRVFYSKHKWPRREGQVGSQRKPGLV